MTFYRGQKVTLKVSNREWQPLDVAVANPEFGAVYTIRDIDFIEGEMWLRFYELVNPPRPGSNGDEEPWFEADAFRPVVERKTDISALQALLNPVKRRERA